MCPQVGQGALAVECRADDADTLARLAAIDDVAAHRARRRRTRAFLAELGSGCDLPCGALAAIVGDDVVASTRCSRRSTGAWCCAPTARDDDPRAAGTRARPTLLDHGGRALLFDEEPDRGPSRKERHDRLSRRRRAR